MAGIKSYANISGLDNTLLMIEGRFNLGMDERVLNVTGEFAKQMDMAAQKVFKGMAVGAETRGLRALPVMGTNLSTPSFLVDVPADQSWRPLNQKYKNRKKSLVSKGRIRTVNMWEYSGSLKRIFQKKSAQLTKISGNTFGNKNFFNTATNTYDSKRISAKKASDRMFMTIPNPQGGNLGANALGYDFEYVAGQTAPNIQYTAQHKTKATGTAVKTVAISNMKRYIAFNIFEGLAKFVSSTLEGNTKAISPEDYIESISGGTAVYKNAGKDRIWDTRKGVYVRDLRIRNKLYYFAKGKRQQRALIQPYMRYYFNKIMIPLARKLINGK